MNLRSVDIVDIKKRLDETGYAILRDVIPTDSIEQIRAFWLAEFAKPASRGRVVWSVYWGQPNAIGFSSDQFQHLYRAIDIAWNPPIDEETRQLCLAMSALRNRVIDQDESFGQRLTDPLGIVTSVSYYPAGKGMMEAHTDGGTGKIMLVHILAPLTFKGKDYKAGGLRMWDRHGNEVDVDAQLNPGDAVIYDGSLKHEVLPIVAMEGKDLGRLQTFPIPMVFKPMEKDIRALGAVPFLKYLRSRYAVAKNALLIALGRKGTLR